MLIQTVTPLLQLEVQHLQQLAAIKFTNLLEAGA
jgi:hypothetical protein